MQRIVRGVYSPVGVPVDHLLRCEAVGLILPPGGQLTGRSATAARGLSWVTTHDPVEVLLPAGARFTMPQGVQVRLAMRVPPGESWMGTTLASPNRTAFDVCSRRTKDWAVAYLDALVRKELLDADDFRRWLETSHDSHVQAAREAAALIDPGAESLPESRLRVFCLDADLTVVTAHEVLDRRGDFVARLDLAVIEDKVAIEYDGAWHALRMALEKDRRRMLALRDLGWEVVSVTNDMMREPASIVDAIRRASRRQRSVPRVGSRWASST